MSENKENKEQLKEGHCKRCGASRNSAKYISCMNTRCDVPLNQHPYWL